MTIHDRHSDGAATSEVGNYKLSLFSPLKLKAVRQRMIDTDLSRGVINQRVGRIKRLFKWGVAEELVPESVYRGLLAVEGLKAGRSGAKYAIGNIPDGTSNTGFVFEAGEAVTWTKPEGLEYDAAKPLPKLGGHFDGICFIGLGDGTVFKMRKDPDAAELDKVIVPDDGIPNNFDKIEAN